MRTSQQFGPKIVTLTINNKRAIFDPLTAQWNTQKQSSAQYKKLQSLLRTKQLRLKQLTNHIEEESEEIRNLKEDIVKEQNSKKQLDKKYCQKVQDNKSLHLTKKFIDDQFKKIYSKRQ